MCVCVEQVQFSIERVQFLIGQVWLSFGASVIVNGPAMCSQCIGRHSQTLFFAAHLDPNTLFHVSL